MNFTQRASSLVRRLLFWYLTFLLRLRFDRLFGSGAAGSRQVIRPGHVRAYFSTQLLTFTVYDARRSPDETVLPLGPAQSLLLNFQESVGLGVITDYEPSDARVSWIDARDGSLRGKLLALAFHLHMGLTGIISVSRRVAVARHDDSLVIEPILSTTITGDVREKTLGSTTAFVAHAIELAARAQTTNPLHVREPIISFVVPVYNARAEHLNDLLKSFRLQTGRLAHLVLADDASQSPETRDWLRAHSGATDVTVIMLPTNGGISNALNAGLQACCSEWVSFVDHDDALTPLSVCEVVRALLEHPECQLLYTDEVITDKNLHAETCFLKPAWDVALLSGVNYINHLSIFRRSRLIAIGAFRSAADGSQDYDLLLRYTAGLSRTEILHLPFPAYVWRRSGSTYSVRFLNQATERARTALSERFGQGSFLPVEGALDPNLHRLRFDQTYVRWPSISIIIPSRDAYNLIETVLRGIFETTDYPNLDVIVIDNGTTDVRTLALYEIYREAGRFQAVVDVAEFNFSAAINKGLELATGDYILLLNNDIEITSSNWLKEMVSCFDYGEVGIVGAKLLYPSGKLQHAGVIAGLGGLAGHWYINEPADFPGPMGRLWVRQTLSCVTGACMLLSRECIEAVGRFDSVNFAIAYNDIDYCLRATRAGFRVIWSPFACMVHHESASRGSDVAPDKIDRFRREQDNLRRMHRTDLLEDPAFNPWYSRMNSHPTYLRRAILPAAR